MILTVSSILHRRTAAVVCGLVYQQAAARGGNAPANPESSLDGDAASFCDHAVACLDVSFMRKCRCGSLRATLWFLAACLPQDTTGAACMHQVKQASALRVSVDRMLSIYDVAGWHRRLG